MRSLRQRLREQPVLIADGAWGTELLARGASLRECLELWTVERPEAVQDIAVSYVDAGADMIGTNTFGGNALRLQTHGLQARVAEFNERAAQLSRAAAGEKVLVLGSMGPSGLAAAEIDACAEELYAAFAGQARALARGGVDGIWIETMTSLVEAQLAVRAVRENTGLDLICTFSFGPSSPCTADRLTAEAAALQVLQEGAVAVGLNCGAGPAEAVTLIARLRKALPGVPLVACPNAGAGGAESVTCSPQQFARFAEEFALAGASIIGGCCGTTPAHIAAMRQARVIAELHHRSAHIHL